MPNPSSIEQHVMRRVHRIAILRIVISGSIFALTLALLALYALGREVWVAKVFENGPQSPLGHALYLVYALEHTRFVVQALALVCLGSVLYLARETARLFATMLAPSEA